MRTRWCGAPEGVHGVSRGARRGARRLGPATLCLLVAVASGLLGATTPAGAAPAPQPTSVVPATRGQGALPRDVDIFGSNFAPGAVVDFGPGIVVSDAGVVDSGHMWAAISVDTGAAVGPRNVTVTNPDGNAGTCVGCFSVSAGPKVTSIDRSSLPQGHKAVTLTVTGTDFQPGAKVGFGARTGVTVGPVSVVSPTTITVRVLIEMNAPIGPRTVFVTNPDGGRGSCSGCFTVTPGPHATTIDPSSLPLGAQHRELVLSGRDFATGISVRIAGMRVHSVTRVDATMLRLDVSVRPTTRPGLKVVRLFNPDGGRGKCFITVTSSAQTSQAGPCPETASTTTTGSTTTTQPATTTTGGGGTTTTTTTGGGGGATTTTTAPVTVLGTQVVPGVPGAPSGATTGGVAVAGSELARTGAEHAGLVRLAVALVLAGCLVLLGARLPGPLARLRAGPAT